uniref:Uncharacterized protein n=1 Tax=Rhodnius prolixus TaxID=13249 RepID=T1I173_RHOPR
MPRDCSLPKVISDYCQSWLSWFGRRPRLITPDIERAQFRADLIMFIFIGIILYIKCPLYAFKLLNKATEDNRGKVMRLVYFILFTFFTCLTIIFALAHHYWSMLKAYQYGFIDDYAENCAWVSVIRYVTYICCK